MKTTTITAAQKRLNALTDRKTQKFPIAKSSMAYRAVASLLKVEGVQPCMVFNNTIRPVYTSGRGRFTSNQDHTFAIKTLLNKIGIEYTFTNDSPKGGLTGNLITITTKIK